MASHRYDDIRQMPTMINNLRQDNIRSYAILLEVKRMLTEYYSADAILDIVSFLESDLPPRVTQGLSLKDFGPGGKLYTPPLEDMPDVSTRKENE